MTQEELNKATEEYTHVGATNDIKELGNTPADKNYKPSGISKEEQLCSACCPYYGKTPDQCGYTERKMQWDCPYFDFIERGYEQAEKDLGLTWEDMKTIQQIIATSDWYDFEINGKLWSQEFYEEVLKRFNKVR